jgi:hypothetical protein
MMTLNDVQIEWLDRCTKGTWNLNPETGLVDVDGGFVCDDLGLTDFKGIRFGTVSKYFSCEGNHLTSLECAPEKVGGSFYCDNNRLTSLEGALKSVGGDFICRYNQLTSLKGISKNVGYIYLEGNKVSEETLLAIYEIMKRSKSYPEALSEYWCEITEKDRSLMYADNPELSADEKRGYELRNRVRGISI